MVTRKEIYMKPRKKKKAFIRTANHYILLFAVIGIVTYVGYELLAKDQLGSYRVYDRFFYVYNIAVFMILNLIFLYSIMKRGVTKTLGLIGISALAFIIFNLASPYIGRFLFKNLEPSIIDFLLNFKNTNITQITIKDSIFFNYIPVFLSLIMWSLLTFIMQPFSKAGSLKRDRKSSLEIQGRA